MKRKKPDLWICRFWLRLDGEVYKAGTKLDLDDYRLDGYLLRKLKHRAKLLAEVSFRTIKRHRANETTKT